jgi:hypothetical protein
MLFKSWKLVRKRIAHDEPVLFMIIMEKGQYCFRWERPPQNNLLNKIKSGMCYPIYER